MTKKQKIERLYEFDIGMVRLIVSAPNMPSALKQIEKVLKNPEDVKFVICTLDGLEVDVNEEWKR